MPLIPNLPIFTKSNNQFVMEIGDKFYKVNEEVKAVIQSLAESNTITEASKKYNETTAENLSEEEFSYYSDEILNKLQLNKATKSFLLVEKKILSEGYTEKAASIFGFLFNPIVFWVTFVGLFTISGFAIYFFSSQVNTNELNISFITFAVLYFMSVILHELGHITACKKYTGKSGEVGVGIYIIYPIFYSNISAIWHANKEQKIITNLAGIYMQLWVAVLAFGLGYILSANYLIEFCIVLLFICGLQLIPFIRSDGYWILSDLFETPNLLDKSQSTLKSLITQPQKSANTFVRKDWFILGYGLVNYILILYFVYYQLNSNFAAIVNFPIYLWQLLKDLVLLNWEHLHFEIQYLSVIIFYLILYNYSKILFNTIKSKLNTN